MRRTLWILSGTALVGVAVLAACTTSGSSGSSAAAGKVRSAPDSASGQLRAPAAANRPTAGKAGSGSGATLLDLRDPRTLIRTAELNVRVKPGISVATQADRAGALVTAVGGQVFADDRTAGKQPTAALTLKVPPTSLTRVLSRLSGLGDEQSRQLSTQDVTAQVTDVRSRATSARESILRLRTLYARAVKVADVIAIENELAVRQADLESLEAQQRTLNAQTSMATVSLRLWLAKPVPGTHHQRRGFVGGLTSGWRQFTSAALAVATALGVVLPFAILALVVFGGLAVVLKRRPHPLAPPPAPGETG